MNNTIEQSRNSVCQKKIIPRFDRHTLKKKLPIGLYQKVKIIYILFWKIYRAVLSDINFLCATENISQKKSGTIKNLLKNGTNFV